MPFFFFKEIHINVLRSEVMMPAPYFQMSWKKLYRETVIKLMGQHFQVCPIFYLGKGYMGGVSII